MPPFDVVKERVVHRRPGRDARLRVVEQRALQDVEARGVKTRANRGDRQARPLRERRVPVLQRGAARPRVLSRCAEQTEDLVDLINLAVTREHRPLAHHLDKDRAHSPHIDRRRVGGRAEEDLGRTVPEGHHLVSERADRRAERARQPEVGELEGAIRLDEEVLRLEVTVHDTTGVAEREAAEDLVRERLGLLEADVALDRVEVALEVLVKELEDQVQTARLLHDVAERDDVRVLELLEERDLTERGRRHALVLELEANFLHGDDVAILLVTALVDDAVGALAVRQALLD
eukprot:CAMPEP_0119499670 /NCGR_PEP_ID=MMETSP1344-20130328/22058_1 /TAXON_ID=236787 /ORGANISM="Florenciella parvula, Strain CCMP2471" /LENGTH=289 /DNA_ID=CAMNT_0007535685 /DNA_START=389 /DNA_END=1256 /DNA_ORIENTATION=+